MSSWPFRFIHASDFHLERPLMGVAEVPDHLRDLFLDAPYTAARQVFDAALAEDAEFRASSRAAFCTAGCRSARAAVFGRAVCPAGRTRNRRLLGRLADRSARGLARGACELPQNVHVFPRAESKNCWSQRRRRTVGPAGRRQLRSATALAAGRLSRPTRRGCTRSPLRMARPTWPLLQAARHPLLGTRRPARPEHAARAASNSIHYCGSPQGRRPEESGVHGCTLVQVDAQRQTRTSLIPTDAVRWIGERIADRRNDHAGRRWNRGCATACTRCWKPTPATALLISWTIAGHGPLLGACGAERCRPSCSIGSAAITAIARRPRGACRWRSNSPRLCRPNGTSRRRFAATSCGRFANCR